MDILFSVMRTRWIPGDWQRRDSLFLWLLFFLLIKAACLFGLASLLGLGLTPDEAQYWTWSQQLDWGYYSKPPAIAWQIWLGTQLFGNTELGVRVVSGLFGIGLGLAVYRLAKLCQLREDIAFWSGLWMAIIPAGWLGSLLAITDVGLILFWTIGCQEVADALQKKRAISCVKLGGAVLVAALFKWVAFLFWPLLVSFLLLYRKETRFMLGRPLIEAMALSLLALVPSFLWNGTHDWATFRHVYATLQGGHGESTGNFWEFIGAQALLVTPLLFVSFWISFSLLQKKQPLACTFLFWVGSSSLLFAIFLAMRQKMQGNWAIFAYPPLVVVAVREIFLRSPRPWMWNVGGGLLTCGVVVGAFLLPILLVLPEKAQPFKQALSWQEMGKILQDVGYRPQNHFLVADTYQTSSLLSFYTTGQKRAYFLPLQNVRNNQFSYWPGIADEQIGNSGYFVRVGHLHKEKDLVEKYQELLQPYFRQVFFVGAYPLWPYEKESRNLLIFWCQEALAVPSRHTPLF